MILHRREANELRSSFTMFNLALSVAGVAVGVPECLHLDEPLVSQTVVNIRAVEINVMDD